MALAGVSAGGRGVDTTDSASAARPAAEQLARETGAVVAVTGEVDYVTDGSRTLKVEPLPSTLSTASSPPMPVTRLWQM